MQMKYEAEITVKFIISDDSGANDEEIVDKILEKGNALHYYLKSHTGPWEDVQDINIDGIYDEENNLIWYE